MSLLIQGQIKSCKLVSWLSLKQTESHRISGLACPADMSINNLAEAAGSDRLCCGSCVVFFLCLLLGIEYRLQNQASPIISIFATVTLVQAFGVLSLCVFTLGRYHLCMCENTCLFLGFDDKVWLYFHSVVSALKWSAVKNKFVALITWSSTGLIYI